MDKSNAKKYPRVRDFYENKTIFVTGGSGFIGRMLIEKLLRSCPKIRKIYLLLRPKKELSPEKRMDKLFSVPLFDKLDKESNGTWRSKIHMINGDVMELNMGISLEDQQLLAKEVNVFFHVAASVRFDDPLKKAIIMNTRGTREACILATKMKNIQMFFHVSTAYCNVHREVVEEEIYPPVADWKQMIHVAETMDEDELQLISTKLIDEFPNTYTFTKNLAEHIVREYFNGKIPAIIMRPSIVVNSIEDPIAGWTDNFNGLSGLMVCCGKGILRANLLNEDVRLDTVPIDYVVRLMIYMVYHRHTTETEESLRNLGVYHATCNLEYALSIKDLINLGRAIVDDVPLKNPLWYPGGAVTSSKILYFITAIFLHILPALLIDLIMFLTGNQPILFKIQKKIYVAGSVFQYFGNQEWKFENSRMWNVNRSVSDEDQDEFYATDDIDLEKYFKNCTIGIKKYLLREDIGKLEHDRKRIFQMKILHYITKTLFWIWVSYLVWTHVNFIQGLGKILLYFKRILLLNNNYLLGL